MYSQAKYDEPTIFELSKAGRTAYSLPKPFGDPVQSPKGKVQVPKKLKRDNAAELPELSEVDVVRHYTKLSQMNYGVDNGIYPLGSCTMKYNPKLNEEIYAWPESASMHPDQDESTVQGCLQVMFELGEMLKEIGGMDAITFQPSAGAHGEYTGLLLLNTYHAHNGNKERDEIIISDSSHGTNPASATMCGYRVVEIPSTKEGTVDLEALKAAVSDKTAGFMLTNPNTLGIFESDIKEIAKIIHKAGGLLYYDGANLNANLGICRPGDFGFDVMHFNLHKSFSTPHGGGGPGSGPVACKKELADFLPVPLVKKEGDAYKLDYDLPNSIGKVRAWYGNYGVILKAYVYCLTMGKDLKKAAEHSVLNANYMAQKLKDKYEMPGRNIRKHEFVLSAEKIKKETGCSALDIAKRLLDYGQHAPTVYFPLIVHEALMIEPTETESKEELGKFIDVMLKIHEECYSNPDLVKNAPQNTSVKRLDITKATREPVLSWRMKG